MFKTFDFEGPLQLFWTQTLFIKHRPTARVHFLRIKRMWILRSLVSSPSVFLLYLLFSTNDCIFAFLFYFLFVPRPLAYTCCVKGLGCDWERGTGTNIYAMIQCACATHTHTYTHTWNTILSSENKIAYIGYTVYEIIQLCRGWKRKKMKTTRRFGRRD